MMTLPPPLQKQFKSKLNQYEKELTMPFIIPIQEMAREEGAIENCQQNILDLLKARFNSVPESLEKSLKNIDDLAFLKQLLIDTISVNSLAEFEQLIHQNQSN